MHSTSKNFVSMYEKEVSIHWLCTKLFGRGLLTHCGDSQLSQMSAIAKGRYCHVTYKLLYPSIRVRTAPPVSVMVRVSVSFCLCILFCIRLHVRTFAIADSSDICLVLLNLTQLLVKIVFVFNPPAPNECLVLLHFDSDTLQPASNTRRELVHLTHHSRQNR